jgi:hypothetical protein
VSSTIAFAILGLSIPVMLGTVFLLRPSTAVLAVALGAEMFLPERVSLKLPLMPPFDKHNLPYLCIFVACLIRYPGRMTKLPRPRWIVGLAVLLLVGGVLTALTNRDSLVMGGGQVYLPALTVKDGFYMGIANFLSSFVPLFLGYALLRKPEDLERLVVGLAVACLVYIPFAMVELRMSPQWHYWIYGYYQHFFGQTLRWGGYRPMVFMSHGLALARFFFAGTCCLLILSRYRRALLGLPIRFLAWTQLLVLIACKSTGAIVFAAAAVPLLAWSKPKRQLLVASWLAVVIVLYPALRLGGIFPVAQMLEAAGAVQADRAESLAFRFRNEDDVLARTRERILFGWGEYDRNAVFDEWGDKRSVLDGYWIIRLSMNGIVGFVASFGPLLIPIWWTRRLLPTVTEEKDRRLVAGLALLLALLALDLIPNGLWAFYPFLLAGALIRRLRDLQAKAQEAEPAVAAAT